jgi:S1-C subfamily serine protease
MNKRLAQTVIEISLRERLRLALLVTLLGVLSAAGADDGESVEELLTAVVGVYATVPEQARTAAALGTERFGSGVVIDSSGLIVTIGYLILEAEKVEIVLPSEELVPVEVLAYDYETGFGLLRAPDRVKIAPMSLGSATAASKPCVRPFLPVRGNLPATGNTCSRMRCSPYRRIPASVGPR